MSSVNANNPSHQATGIFISYRRADTAGQAGRLHEALAARFRGRLFMDINTIEAGQDFVEAIQNALSNCKVLLVMIGDQWATITNSAGQRRLDDPDDFVRIEIAEALKRDICVIPVLVEGASMPRKGELPPDLTKLLRHHAIELSETRWTYDVGQLVKVLKKLGAGGKKIATWKIVTVIAAVVALMTVLIGKPHFSGCPKTAFDRPIVKNPQIYLLASPEKFKDKKLFNELHIELWCAGFENIKAGSNRDKERPDQPEIRYYNGDNADQADALAKVMREKFRPSQFPIAHRLSSGISPGYIEIWLGR